MADADRELKELVAAAATGGAKPVYLVIGESADTARAARALIDALVPEARRAFNLESYDGRTIAMATVLDTLRTPGFFAGDKVVWVKESSVFLSGEKRTDVTRSMLDAWRDERAHEAAERLLTLVALAGWDDSTWRATRWQDVSKSKAKEVFGDALEDGDFETLDAIQAAALARELCVAAYRDEAAELTEWLESPATKGAVAVFSSATVDGRKKIVKTIGKLGAIIDLTAERERSGSLAKATIEQVMARVLDSHGKRLEPAAREMIVRRAGVDTGILASEIEKLCLYVGERPAITEADARTSFPDLAESWVFDFTAALAARDGAKALPVLRSLLAQGEPPLRLIGMIARELRLLLIARECLDGSLSGKFNASQRYDAFQSRVLPAVDPDTKAAFGNAHPFVLFRRFQDATRVRAAALRDALLRLAELDLRMKSAPNDPAVLVEAFVFGWCTRGRRA